MKSLQQNQYCQLNLRCGFLLFVEKLKSMLLYHISWRTFGRIYWKLGQYQQGQWGRFLYHFLKSKAGRINQAFDYSIGKRYCSDGAHKNGCQRSTAPRSLMQSHPGPLLLGYHKIAENKLQTAFVSWAFIKKVRNNGR